MLRTHTCGELKEDSLKKEVTLTGWVNSRRDHGNLIFVDLRDRYGITQIVFNPEKNSEAHEIAESLRSEFVILVKGVVEKRPAGTENTLLPTGKIEVYVNFIKILNTSVTPPFEISDEINISEETRLLYRYLDLRRPKMQKSLEMRHRIIKIMRDSLDKDGFLEIETPVLTKSTPEGARDFLVPSRLNEGKFYALPQSPQLFKQILMVSGCDKYFQIARCFRDEDLRADRQPEFTQLDIEMSFITEEDIFSLTERLMKNIIKGVTGKDLITPFRRLPYSEAMLKYGSDKPDLRYGLEICDLSETLKGCEFKIFKSNLEKGGRVAAIVAPGMADISRKEIDDLTEFAKIQGAAGLAYFKVLNKALQSPIDKFFKPEELNKIKEITDAKEKDLILFISDNKTKTLEILGSLRRHLAQKLNLIKSDEFQFLWIVDFPLFKYNDEEKRWESEHHPFTSVHPEDMGNLDKDPSKIRSRSYDLVINGIEIGSGSIRIHERLLQEKIFKIIGIKEDEAKLRFGFLLNAFGFGAPPHGGVAFGIDRFTTLFTKSESIRDVIAFPKTQKGTCLMTDAPSSVDEKQLRELGIKLK